MVGVKAGFVYIYPEQGFNSQKTEICFCLILKFGHAIFVRVLMLNLETSYTNRPLHNEHENARNHL